MEKYQIKLLNTENNKQISSSRKICDNPLPKLCDLNKDINEEKRKIENITYEKKDEDETEDNEDVDKEEFNNDNEDKEESDDNNEEENNDVDKEREENDDKDEDEEDKEEEKSDDNDEEDEDEEENDDVDKEKKENDDKDEDKDDEDEEKSDDNDEENKDEDKNDDEDEDDKENDNDEDKNDDNDKDDDGNDRNTSENSKKRSLCYSVGTIEQFRLRNPYYLINESSVCNEKWINIILTFLHKVCESDYTKLLEYEIYLLQIKSRQPNIKDYLRKNNFLSLAQNLLKYQNESELIDMILGIVINIYDTNRWIDIIGNKKNLVINILMRLKLNDCRLLAEFYVFLRSVILTIQEDPKSIWISHLKECEFFGSSITSNLQNSNKGSLLIAAIALLQSISMTYLSQSNFLVELFKINHLVPALLRTFTQLIPLKSSCYWKLEYQFFTEWLQVFSTIIELNLFKFEKDEDKILLSVYDVIEKILIPYRYAVNLSVLNTPYINIIKKCINILQHFHLSNLNVPVNLDRSLMNIICFLKKGFDWKKFSSNSLAVEVLNYLLEYWASTAKYHTTDNIRHILLCLNSIDREIFIKIVMTTDDISNETFKQVLFTYFCLRSLKSSTISDIDKDKRED